MIRLNDKEILALDEKEEPSYYRGACDGAQAQLKKFREWLKSEVLEDCHEGYSNVMCFHKRALRELEDDKTN